MLPLLEVLLLFLLWFALPIELLALYELLALDWLRNSAEVRRAIPVPWTGGRLLLLCFFEALLSFALGFLLTGLESKRLLFHDRHSLFLT